MNVLYATDGSDPSRAAADLLAALGNRSAIDITVVSIADLEPVIPDGYLAENELQRVRRRLAEKEAARAAAQLVATGFSASEEVAEGRPGQAIVRTAERRGCGLVVVGAGHHTWLGNLLLGSTSTYVLHSWPGSVLVVHEAPRREGLLRVLVATDGSHGAGDAAAMLRALADPSRCEVTVLSVAQIPNAAPMGYPFAPVAPTGNDEVTELVEQARRYAEETADVLRHGGFRAEAVATDGAPHHLVLSEADKGGYGLVVVGSRGHGPIRRSLLGSVSDAVARHARAALVGRTPEDATRAQR